MTIEWLAGNRLRGTTAERPVSGLTAPSVGGWVELARTTLGSAGDTISVGSLADKRYLMFLCDTLNTGGSTQPRIRGGNSTVDTGSNYSQRMQRNGAADATGTSDQSTYLYDADNSPQFMVGYYANLSAKEKLGLGHTVVQSTAGAGTAPLRQETVWKHAFTSNPYDVISINNIYGTGDFNTGSELVVLGWDPADSHTTNFWEELASVDLSGGAADNLSSGTFTAKKYLWVQGYFNGSGAAVANVQFNGDTSGNYAQRHSLNGASDVTSTSRTNLESYSAANIASGTGQFINLFIINNSANEKLIIGHISKEGTAGAGTAPNRSELAWKWANTSAQITSINFVNTDTGDLGTTSSLKVWGSD